MNETQFIEQFVVNFIATWAANNFEDCCINNNHERLNNPPIEDAHFLAKKAWEHKQELNIY